LAELDLSVEEARINVRVHELKQEMAKGQAEEEKLRSLRQKRAELADQVAGLTVRAPRAGQIVGRGLEALEGMYLATGSEVLSIGEEQVKEIRMSIAQVDIEAFRRHAKDGVRAYLPGSIVLQSTLLRIEPRATVTPLAPSLCAPDGGSLAVRDIEPSAESPGHLDYELLAPRFTGIMQLSAAQSTRVFAGQRSRVALRPYESVGRHLYQLIAGWVDARLQRA
jgi:hypothetical protein